ncbi:alpha-L-arabinofuranosidase B [Lichenicoccus sp.]|uniref:alpha-L-arabinofuranosidase B n=1 Tax=Lichenicoccus sp. TaxID=2781899 RepID=UPI003D09E80D
MLAAWLITTHGGSAHAAALGPCDIYGNTGTPCVAAHSTTRALYASYDGPLYDVARFSDSKVKKIGLLTTGGYANAAAQDAFCKNTVCMITRIYDQSPLHNDLTVEGSGGNGHADVGARADALPVVVDGHAVYGLLVFAGVGYRNDKTIGVATNGQPEGMYMVTSGTHVNGACCFDYGNAEVNNDDNGNGHMDAINFGTECWFAKCYGTGPWVQADMENGLFASNEGVSEDTANTGNTSPFVTALIKNNGQNAMAIKAGDATQGLLSTTFSGGEPVVNGGGYSPMHQEGAIVLGTGGDNSNGSIGSFFEGVMTAGFPTDATDNEVQANIVSVGYGGATGIVGNLKSNAEISLLTQSPCCQDYYLSHQGSASTAAVIAPVATGNATEAADATWIVRPGLANATCLSFEARNRPGDYLRHYNFQLMRESYDGTSQFEEDGTFCPVKGNDGSGKSFQSFNYPTKFIRDYNYNVYVAGDGGTNAWDTTIGFPNDSSWTVKAPLSP